MTSKARWLEAFTWLFMVAQTEILCSAKSTYYRPTSDGHADAIARILVRRLNLESTQEHFVRSLAGHIVAGVASDEEIHAFRKFCESLG